MLVSIYVMPMPLTNLKCVSNLCQVKMPANRKYLRVFHEYLCVLIQAQQKHDRTFVELALFVFDWKASLEKWTAKLFQRIAFFTVTNFCLSDNSQVNPAQNGCRHKDQIRFVFVFVVSANFWGKFFPSNAKERMAKLGKICVAVFMQAYFKGLKVC